MFNETEQVKLIGHVQIVSDQVDGAGNIIPNTSRVDLEKFNAIHPQNMARIVARALSNESNTFIKRVAFGNGGTIVDFAGNITFRAPRDGLNVGDNGWEARLYNETYSEVVDDSDLTIGSGPGSSPGDDPVSVEHVSGPGVRSVENLTTGATVSSVIVTAVLNANEPSGQALTQQGGSSGNTNIEADFVFDEIGLFTSGSAPVDTVGYQFVDVGNKEAKHDTGLTPNTTYQFSIRVNNGSPVTVTVLTPLSGSGDGTSAPIGSITYADIISVMNSPVSNLTLAGAVAKITDDTPTQLGGSETFGYLKFESLAAGTTSSIQLNDINMFNSIDGFDSILNAVNGTKAGVRNDPTNPTNERERLLTHLTFSPIEKSADRVMTLTYTIHVVVARSVRT